MLTAEQLKALQEKAKKPAQKSGKLTTDALRRLSGKASAAPSSPITGDGSQMRAETFGDKASTAFHKGLPGDIAAFMSSLVNGSTFGTLPDMQAASHAGFAGPQSFLMGPVNAGARAVGHPLFDASQERAASDALAKEHPKSALVGDMLSYILPGAGIEKAGAALVGKSPASVKALTGFLGEHALGRMAKSGANMALQDAARSVPEQTSMPLGAIEGFLGGAIGHGLFGEALPNAYRYLAGADAPQKGADLLRSVLSLSKTSKVKPAQIKADLAAAGEGAILGDVPALGNVPKDLMYKNSNFQQADPLKLTYLNRVGEGAVQGKDLLSTLKGKADAIIPQDWKMPQAMDAASLPRVPKEVPRTEAQFARSVAETKAELSPQYEALLTNAKGAVKPHALVTMLDDAMKTFDDGSLTDTLRGAREFIKSRIGILTTNTNGAQFTKPLSPAGVRTLLTDIRDYSSNLSGKPGITDRGTASLLRGRLSGIAHQIEAATLDNIPGYAALNSKFKSAVNAADSHSLGNNFLHMTSDNASVAADAFRKLAPDAQPAFFEGLSNSIASDMGPAELKKLLSSRSIPDAANALLGNSQVQAALRAVMPDASADDLIAAATAAAEQMKSVKAAGVRPGAPLNTIFSNATARDRRAAARLTLGAFFTKALNMGSRYKVFQPSAAAAQGALTRLLDASQIGPRETRIVADALNQTGPAANTAIDNIFSGALPDTVARPPLLNILDKLTKPGSMVREQLGASVGASAATGAVNQRPR